MEFPPKDRRPCRRLERILPQQTAIYLARKKIRVSWEHGQMRHLPAALVYSGCDDGEDLQGFGAAGSVLENDKLTVFEEDMSL